MQFNSLQLIEPLLRSLHEEGYRTPTPIQAQAIPIILEGKDLLGVAQTGTGKTAAFALPIIQTLVTKPSPSKRKGIRSLILTPTRELAVQIEDSFRAYGRHTGLSSVVVFGGVKQGKQTAALRRGVDIVIATPGRLLDLMDQGFVNLQQVEIFVLDEADRMLDMGFVRDVRDILTTIPKHRQSLFFSATMPPAIVKLAHEILNHPVRVEVTPARATVDLIEQSVYYVDTKKKPALLLHLLEDESIRTALVFTRTKHGADSVVRTLERNHINAEAIHGNKSQNARQRALDNFKAQHTRVLVATDIAARGIDVDDLEYVINYEIPNVPETYVHRIGRTGRAGASGTAISLCGPDEKGYLREIEKLIKKRIPAALDHSFAKSDKLEVIAEEPRQQRPRQGQGRSQGGRPSAGRAPGGRPQEGHSPADRRPQAGRQHPGRSEEGRSQSQHEKPEAEHRQAHAPHAKPARTPSPELAKAAHELKLVKPHHHESKPAPNSGVSTKDTSKANPPSGQAKKKNQNRRRW